MLIGGEKGQCVYGLFGKMRAQSGQRDALIGHLLNGADTLCDLDGCYLYVISSDPEDPDGIWIYETWRSQADHQASLTHESVRTLISLARPLIADMPVRIEVSPLGGKGLPADVSNEKPAED